jgi:hypothetical protein
MVDVTEARPTRDFNLDVDLNDVIRQTMNGIISVRFCGKGVTFKQTEG